uniref:Asialoglycoprotein receptor 2-like n=1 Tax=Saccoglossus kowalevskii TaxID=10224 RepID=A0ABM0MYM1_SACKO|nr:PREDICTED: asialoglycoprotein receptor 2-like [Saccoglossus kowalevskii]
MLPILLYLLSFGYGETAVNYTVDDSNVCKYTFMVPTGQANLCSATSTEVTNQLQSLQSESRSHNEQLSRLATRLVQVEAELMRQSNQINDLLTDIVMSMKVQEKTCKEPWIQMGQSCYWFAKKGQSTNWSNARLFCQVMDADLLVINNNEEKVRIEAYVDVLDATNSWWLGCTNVPKGKWHCVDNTTLDFSNWSSGHPSSRLSRCVHMWRLDNQAWNDAHCNQDWAFICEKKIK